MLPERTVAIVGVSVCKRHSSRKRPSADSHLFWYHSAQVCASGRGIHFVRFFPGKSRHKRWRYCFCFSTLKSSVFCSNPFKGCQLTELCSLCVSKVKENKYLCSYCVSGSNNNTKEKKAQQIEKYSGTTSDSLNLVLKCISQRAQLCLVRLLISLCAFPAPSHTHLEILASMGISIDFPLRNVFLVTSLAGREIRKLLLSADDPLP